MTEQELVLKYAEEQMRNNPRGSLEHKQGYFLNLFGKMSIHDQLNFIYEGIVELGLAKEGSELVDLYNQYQKDIYEFVVDLGFVVVTSLNVTFYIENVA